MGHIYSINIYKLQRKYHFNKKTYQLLCTLSSKENFNLANDLKKYKKNINIKNFINIWLSRLMLERHIINLDIHHKQKLLLKKLGRLF
jgi:hypothetical protein